MMQLTRTGLVRAAGLAAAVATLLWSQVTITTEGDFRVVRGDGIPNHETGSFPNALNPNSIQAQNYTFRIPLNPRPSEVKHALPLGPVAVAVNGIPFFSMYTANYQNAVEGVAADFLDACNGHPQQRGMYHYHGVPNCIVNDTPGRHSGLIGWAWDGYGIYGPQGVGGQPPADLDDCAGHTDDERGYHYHTSDSFPYSIGCYAGVVEESNLGPGLLLTPFVTSASAAGYDMSVTAGDSGPAVARGSAAAVFGENLADDTVVASGPDLPEQLGSTQVLVTQAQLDGSQRRTTAQQLYFVSPKQVNYLVSTSLAGGGALIEVVNGATRSAGVIHVTSVAPGLFSIDGTGAGPAAGYAVLAQDGARTYVPLFRQTSGDAWETNPITADGAEVYLELYGTGFANAGGAGNIHVTVGGVPVPTTYAAAHGSTPGLDQLDAGPLPASLFGPGEAHVTLTAAGRASNGVTIELR